MSAPSSPAANATLEVQREDLAEARIYERAAGEPGPGEVQVEVERFALTANNITYGLIGEQLGYWDFFPALERESGWGRLPAMGWGKIVASEVEGLEVGRRYYGWYPMARFCNFTASANKGGFRDDGPHRSEHARIYRTYERTPADPTADGTEEIEDRHALLRGLFATAVLAEDFFAESDYFGAGAAILLSASSKTAIGFAQRAVERDLDEVIAVTSPGNREFVEGLGLYSRVLTYGEEDGLPLIDSVLIDMSGSSEVLARVHSHLQERLKYSMLVGMSHQQFSVPEPSDGPTPEFFFAPTQVEKRSSELGADAFRSMVGAGVGGLIMASSEWLTIQHSQGPEAALDVYHEVRRGGTSPAVGRIVSLH